MDPLTLIGVALGFAAIFVSTTLEGGNPMAMFLLPPMLLVIGGSLAVGLAGNTMGDAARFGKDLVKLDRDSLFLSANHQVVVR